MKATWMAWCALAALCAAILVPGVHRAHAEPPDEGLIVAVGDSLTAGLGVPERDAWPAQLERRLRAAGYRWKVVNAGISGETSSGARARLEWVLRLNPDIVALATGANDGLRGIPPHVLQGNLDAMLTTLSARRVTAVLVGMQMLRNLGSAYTTAFARVYPDVALRHRPVFIPFLLEGVAGNPALNQADGLHPTAAGYRVVTDLVYPGIVKAIERVRADRSSLPAR
jgi:acyl-CoA thioesterase-1